ncbi:MAG: hypothetical protein ACO1OT_00190 [Heyndrickxia sp.]
MSKGNKFKNLLDNKGNSVQQEEALKKAHQGILQLDLKEGSGDLQTTQVNQNRDDSENQLIVNPLEAFQQKEKDRKKLTFEMTHTRQTYFIKNDLIKKLNALAKKEKNGFKTYLVNYALEQVLNQIDNKKS